VEIGYSKAFDELSKGLPKTMGQIDTDNKIAAEKLAMLKGYLPNCVMWYNSTTETFIEGLLDVDEVLNVDEWKQVVMIDLTALTNIIGDLDV